VQTFGPGWPGVPGRPGLPCDKAHNTGNGKLSSSRKTIFAENAAAAVDVKIALMMYYLRLRLRGI